MGSSINSAMRYKTISEMTNKEEWYISINSLAFDFTNTREELWVLFHHKPYSQTLYISDYDSWSSFDISIRCNIKRWKKYYHIENTDHHIIHKDLSFIPEQEYIILSAQNKIIDIFDANKENIDNEELDEQFFYFIESVLEQDEEDENDSLYGNARDIFTDTILEYSKKDNWEKIKNILYNIAIYSQDDIKKSKILEELSYPNTCKEFLISLSKQKEEWYIEPQIETLINTIAQIFTETFNEASNKRQTENIQKNTKEENIERLKKELKNAINTEDYKKAAKCRDDLQKLWYKTEE